MFDHADFKGIENMPTRCRASTVFNVCTNSIFQNCLNLTAILLGNNFGSSGFSVGNPCQELAG